MMRFYRLGQWAAAAAMLSITLSGCSGTRPVLPADAREKFRRGMVKYEQGKLDQARHFFESLLFDNPGAVMADSAQYLIATCYYRQKEYELAAGEFQRFYVQYPTSPLVDDAELMRARCYFYGAPKNVGLDQQYIETTVNIIRAFQDDHPTSPLLPAADSLLLACWERLSRKDFKAGKLYYRMGAYSAAQVYFQLVIDQFPESPLVPQSIFMIGESFRRREIYDTAVTWYEKLIYLYPENPITPKARKRVARLHSFLATPSPVIKDE